MNETIDQLRAELEKCQADCEAMRGVLEDLSAVVRGECPSLLEEGTGGSEPLKILVSNALSTTSGQSILDQLHKLEVALKSALNVLEILKVSGMSRTWVIIEERDKLIDSTIATIKSCIGGEQ